MPCFDSSLSAELPTLSCEGWFIKNIVTYRAKGFIFHVLLVELDGASLGNGCSGPIGKDNHLFLAKYNIDEGGTFQHLGAQVRFIEYPDAVGGNY